MKPVPSFLRGVTSTPAQSKDLSAKVLFSWMKTHAFITKLRPSADSINTLLVLMFIEYQRGPRTRWDIFARLYMKYSRFRREVERAEIRLRAASR